MDAHSAMVMAQGFTKEQAHSILGNIDDSALIDGKTKMLLHLSEKINRESSKIHEGTLKEFRDRGCSDEELFETIAVTALFNFMDRMADSLGVPVEGFQDMTEKMDR